MPTDKEKAAAEKERAERAHDSKAPHAHKADDDDKPKDQAHKDLEAKVSEEDKAARDAVKQAEKEEAERLEKAKEPKEYPKWIHHETDGSIEATSAEHEKRMGKGWSDKAKAPEPVKPTDLSAERRAEIQAEADAKVVAEEKARQDQLKRGGV